MAVGVRLQQIPSLAWQECLDLFQTSSYHFQNSITIFIYIYCNTQKDTTILHVTTLSQKMCGYIQGYIKNHAYTGGFIVSRAQFLNYVQFKFMHLLQMICFPGTRLTNDKWRKTDSADTRMPYSGCILELREKSASHCQPASIKLSSRNFPHFRMKQITWLGYFQTIYQHSSSCVIISQFFCFLFLEKNIGSKQLQTFVCLCTN